MTQINKDPLLNICKPYLLDVMTAVTTSLTYPYDQLTELMEGKDLRLTREEYKTLTELTEIEKIKLLSEITTWLLEGEKPATNN